MGRVVQPNNYFSQEDSFGEEFNNNNSLSSRTFEEVWSGNFLTGDSTGPQNNSSLSSNRSYDDVWSGFSLSAGSSQDFNGGWSEGNSFGGGGSGSSSSTSFGSNSTSFGSNSTSFGSSNTSSSSTQQQSSTSRQSTQRPAGHSSRWSSTQWFIVVMNHTFKG